MRATDGSRITFNETTTASGDYQFLPTQIKDRNGNFITIVYKTLSNNDRVVDYVTDTLSRRIDFYYENNRLREIRQDRAGTLFRFVIINYEPVTISLSGATDPASLSGTQVYLPTRITYPTGAHFRFLYTGCGQIYQLEKWAPGVTGQGAARRIGYTAFDQLAGYPLGEGGSMAWRTEQAENWTTATYSYYYNNPASAPAPYNLFHWVSEPGDYSDPLNPVPGRLFRLYHGSSLSRALGTGDSSTTFKEQRVDYTQDSGVS
jgi:hypothetical protein